MARKRTSLLFGLALAVVAAVVAVALALADPGSRTTPIGSFSSDTAATATVWAIGDGATGTADAKRTAQLAERDRPERLIYLGDVYENGTADEYRTRYAPVYGGMREITLPTPGNHEWADRVEGYYPYWARVLGAQPPDYYSVRIAGWDLISLNSEGPHHVGSSQVAWLAGQVASGGDCRLAFWHRPRYSAGMHGDEPSVAPLWDMLKRRASLVLNGHDHNLQELHVRDGIRTLISGAGGSGRYPIDPSDPRLEWGTDQTFGALRLRLSPGLARYDFFSTDGQRLHSGSATCTNGSDR